MREWKKIYAVDFDGTLAETNFPDIIAPINSMFEICKDIRKNGDILILWTCRDGEDLAAAVEYCRENGLDFDYINENVPENVEKFGNDSRKVFAHVYIDDKAVTPRKTMADQVKALKAYTRQLVNELKGIWERRIDNGKERIM